MKDARVTAKARATVETRDEAYARVPLRIDLDGARASDDDDGARDEDARASPRLVAHYGFDATTSAVSYARDQHALFAASEHGVKAFGARGTSEETRHTHHTTSSAKKCRDANAETASVAKKRSSARAFVGVGLRSRYNLTPNDVCA